MNKNKKLTIKDLYASNDFIAGLKVGKRLNINVIYKIIPESRDPITIDTYNWIYIRKTNIILIHEIYDNKKYIRTDEIKIPKRLLF